MAVTGAKVQAPCPWHGEVMAQLLDQHAQGRLPHALLLTGAKGIGKLRLAESLAQTLLCEKPSAGLPCGHCQGCQLSTAGTHPDLHRLSPEEKSKTIKIDQVRKLVAFATRTAQYSGYRVAIVYPAEALNRNAQNALLKTLEEPPGESFLLLEAERPGSVLPTIRSRCQTISLPLPSHDDAMRWLLEQGVAAEDAEVALKRNANEPLTAYDWITSELSGQQNHWLEQLQQWMQGSLPLQVIADPWSKQFADVLAWWYDLSCDLMRAASGAPPELCRHGHLATDLLHGVAADTAKLITFLDKLQHLNAELMSGAAHHNKTLTIEVLLLEWRRMFTAPVGASLS